MPRTATSSPETTAATFHRPRLARTNFATFVSIASSASSGVAVVDGEKPRSAAFISAPAVAFSAAPVDDSRSGAAANPSAAAGGIARGGPIRPASAALAFVSSGVVAEARATCTGGMARSMGAGLGSTTPNAKPAAAAACAPPAAFTAAAFSRCMAKKWCVFFPAACAASRAFCSRISALSASRAEAAAAAAAASAFSAARRLRSSGFMKNGLGAAGFEGGAAVSGVGFESGNPSTPSRHASQYQSPSGTVSRPRHFA